ncbi:MAG: hypothetical protein IJI60_01495 [Bacilli bacterium]|nr:hypothetical protein [Bacilli bacterium]
MKKKILLILFFLLILILSFIFYQNKKEQPLERIYLSEKYYKEESGEFIKVEKKELEKNKEETYILYTYNSFCSFPISCESIFKEFMETHHIDFVSIPFAEFKKTLFYPKVKYAPSIIIIQNQKIIAYLDAESNEDIERYQDVEKLKQWLEKYIYLSIEE